MTHFLKIVWPLFFVTFACIGGGAILVRPLKLKASLGLCVPFSVLFFLGQGLLGSGLILLALAGLFNLTYVATLLFIFACLGLCHVFLNRRNLYSGWQGIGADWLHDNLLWKITAIAVVLALAAGMSGVGGRIDGDARAFYLALPKVIAASHRLVPLPGYETFTSVGLLAEIQLAVLFLLGMPGASARLFCWVTGMAAATVLGHLAAYAGLGRRGQILCLAMLGTSSAVAFFWGQGKTDLFAAGYGLCAVLFALSSWKSVARRYAIFAAGGLTAFALVAKLSYLVAFLPCMAILLLWGEWPQIVASLRDAQARTALLKKYSVELLIFFGAMLVIFLPHLAKNLFLFGTLGETYGNHQYFSPETTKRIVLTYPLLLIFGNFWAQYGNLSPLLLAFFPLFFLLEKNRNVLPAMWPALLVAAISGLLCWIAIFPAVPMPRYFLATLLLLFIPAAWAGERFSQSRKILGYAVPLASIVVISIFVKASSIEIFPFKNAYDYLVRTQTEQAINVDERLSYEAYTALNNAAEPGARVYLISYFRFWMRPDLIQVTNGIRDGNIGWDEKNPDQFWLKLHENGFTYLFVDRAHPALEEMRKKPSWVRLEQLHPQSNYGGVYRVIYTNPPESRKWTTREIRPGAWDVVPVN
jgi:hypothetical protein